MIVVKLMGGLGNQMFQYAAARGLAKNGPVYTDQSFFKINKVSTDAFTARCYRLDVFKQLNVKKLDSFSSAILGADNLIAKVLKRVLFPGLIYWHGESPIAGKMMYLDGYFQSEVHFRSIRSVLLKEFEFSELNSKAQTWHREITQSSNAVSIHVRRGDYLNAPVAAYHGLLHQDYYRKAIALIEARVSRPQYFIFSDDATWCRQAFAFLGPTAQVVENDDQDWADMALMSRCKHNIIANSSFSWWAAWLNTNPEKIVIAPKKWFMDKAAYDKAANLIPPNWISL